MYAGKVKAGCNGEASLTSLNGDKSMSPILTSDQSNRMELFCAAPYL